MPSSAPSPSASTSSAAPQRPRIAPAEPPFAPAVQSWLERTMPPGVPPLALFTTLARDERLFGRFFAGGLLDRGHLTLRQRELVIHRVTARCGAEYEWGVHAALFAARVGFDAAQLHSLVHGGPDDACWSDDERLLLALVDTLHARDDVDDALWSSLAQRFGDAALLELLLLAGFYATVSWLANALRLAPEPFAARFPPRG